MVLKGPTVLSFLFPARLGFGPNQRPDPPTRPRNQEKRAKDHHHHHHHSARLVTHDRLSEPELDPFRGNHPPLHRTTDSNFRTDLSRVRANTVPSNSAPPPLLIPNGGIGESPAPAHRSLGPTIRPKRSSCTTFFAFSSKRRSTHGTPTVDAPRLQQDLLVPPNSVSGRWASGSSQTPAHLINPSSIPSPLQTDEEEYYYSYYTSLSPIVPSQSASPLPDAATISPSKRLSSRHQDHLVGNPDLDSQHSSPVDPHLSHTHIHHPYAYSTPLRLDTHSKTVDTAPPLRHATSQPFHHHPQGSRSDIDPGLAHGRSPPPRLGHDTSENQPDFVHTQLKTSMSTPNLASGATPVRLRSLIKKKPPRSKGQERWLSAESWWDALLSPSPRFKLKKAPRPRTGPSKIIHDSMSKPVQGEPYRNLGVTFPSVSAPRPRAVSVTSVTSNVEPRHPALARSRSTTDLIGAFAAPRAGFEPALETLVDESVTMPNQAPGSEAEHLPLDPPLSLEQVIDEGEAFEHQRAQWKQQAYKSLGNKHTRSFSRARSKSLGTRHARGHHTSENSKAQFNFEFLAARTLLGSQSTMPTVHVTKPSSSSSHSKAYSHSHSQSAHSYSRASHSHAYSHSHSHSLTTSNSSKSSRNLLSRGHSRSGSWGKPAFLKAGALCGISQDESYSASPNDKVPSSSRVDVQGTVHIGDSTNAQGASDSVKVSPFQSIPGGEVGIAITSPPPSEGCFSLKVPGHVHVSRAQHQEADQESRWSSKYTHKPSEYAGPHPSAIDSNLPQLGTASDVSLRHRLPPRAAVHPPIAPIAHPYRSALAHPGHVGDKGSEGAALKATEGQKTSILGTKRTPYPHISLSHADFERYGVGEALVYASHPRQEDIPEANVESTSSLATESLLSEGQSLRESVVLQPKELDTPLLAINNPPSLTNSTIQMVMSALDNPDDLDEFQDLFYKPHSPLTDQEPNVAINQLPTDVRGSTPNSPLTHLVRKLSEEVHGLQDPSRAPPDPTPFQRSETDDHRSNDSGSKFVFMDLARSSSSVPVESSLQLHLPIQKGSESTAQPVMVIPEDVNSSYTASLWESPLEEYDTFGATIGYPAKHGQYEAATAPSLIESPTRASTHLSVQDADEEGRSAFLTVGTRHGSSSADTDAVRSSYVTTSDMSQISALSDFPLPPSVQLGERPGHTSILQTYSQPTPLPESENREQRADDEAEQGDQRTDSEGNEEPCGDVDVTLRALRMASRITSLESHRSTFGGSDDMDFITQLHQARP